MENRARTRYLHWAKTHSRVQYELTNSGVPTASLQDIEGDTRPVDLVMRGPYGHPELIAAIAGRYNVDESRVVPVLGATAGIFVALASCSRHGDRLAIETPLYEPVRRVAEFLGTEVNYIVRVPNHGFSVRLDNVEECLSRGVRVVVLTNLHNPSGQLADEQVMEQLARCCASFGAILVVDEVYLDSAHLSLGLPRWTAATLADNIVSINSLTKVYGLGPLRVGWVVAPNPLVPAIHDVVNLTNSDNPSPSEALAVHAFSRMGVLEDRFRRFYALGQRVYREWLAQEPRVSGYASCGALFECVRLPDGVSSDELNDRLVAAYDTRVVPGSFFGLRDHVRLTTAVPAAELQEALTRISRALSDMGTDSDHRSKL